MTPSYPYTHHRNPRHHRRHHHHHNDPRLLAITLLLFTGACLCSSNAHHDVKSGSKAGTRSSQQDKSSSDDVNTGNDVNREANTSDDNTNKNAINKTANKINPNRMELSNINDVIKHYDNMFADNNKNNEVSTVKLKTIPKMTNFTNHDISNINNDEATTIDNDYTNHDISNINNDEATTIDNDYTNLTTNKSVCSNSIDNNNNNDNNNDNNSDDNSNKDTNNSVCCNSIDNNNNNNKDNNNSNNNTNANYKANFKLNTKIPSNHNNNNHSSTAQTIHRYHHTQRQWNEFYDALLTCKSESITIISDQPKIQRSVMKTVGKLGIPFSQALDDNGNDVTFDDLQQLDRFIRKSYQPAQRNSMSMARDTQNFFIIATEKPDLVLRRVESVFLEEPYRELALLPHRTKWFVFFSTERQWEDLVAQQYRSILDNVVAMKITEVRGSMPYYTLDGISTFMWRPNRTREPSPVDLHSKDKNACVLFPNKDGGMNGRRVTVAPKIYMRRFLTETESPVDGKKMYKGILMDVLDFSSNSSNFTYTLEGENPDGVSYNEMNWKIYAEYLNNGTFDIALSPWSTLFHPFFNVSFSFPFSFDHIIGIYRRPDGRNDYKDALVFLCPFSPIGYVFLVACALYMSILYTLTRNSYNLGSHNFCSNFNPCYIACKRKRQSASSDLQESEEKIGRFRFRFRFSSESTLYNALMDRISVWCLFLITALNQGQLPRPRHTSARLVIGVWAIGIVFYYAVFSSLITAQVAIPRDDPPFTTFKEFLKRNDYSGSIMNETVLIFIMRSASKSSQLGLLRQKSQTFQLARKSNEAIDQNLPTYLEDLKPNVVFFHYESEIRACLRLLGNPDNYVVMENDPIFKSDMALVFPKDSEFDGIVSGDIGMMRESGLQKKIHRQHDAFTWNKKKRSPLMRDKYQVIEIRHMFWIGVTCSVCLLVSAVALILEVSVYRSTEITAKLSSLLPSRMA